MNINKIIKTLMIFGVLIALAFNSACQSQKSVTTTENPEQEVPAGAIPIDTTLKDIQDRGVLRFGVLVDAPWAMKDLETNEWYGVNVDIGNWIAEQLEVKLELVETDWSRVVPDVITGKIDVAAPGLSATPVRAQVIDFTKPYAEFGYIFPVLKSRDDINSMEDLNNPEIRVALHAGATSQLATEFYLPNAEILAVTQIGYAALLGEILSGRSETMPLVSILVPAYIIEFPELKFLPSDNWREDSLFNTPVVFGVQKGRPDLVHFLNNCIDNMQLKGFIDRSFETWLVPEQMIK